jgi:glucoamylase
MDRLGRRLSVALLAGVALVAALLLVSGDERADPRTPPALPGKPPPFLGVAVLGDGELTSAVDAYGNVVDLRAPGPAGRALIDNPMDRQATGTVAADTGIQTWVRIGDRTLPMWRADSIQQRYLAGTNVLRTVARFGRARVEITQAARGRVLMVVVGGEDATVRLRIDAEVRCEERRRDQTLTMACSTGRPGEAAARVQGVVNEAALSDRRWLSRSRPLGRAAPAWAKSMYERSLLVLRALTDRRTGAVAAGARDGWAYVWPRDAATAALAFAAAGYRPEAERVTRFLLGLDLEGSARFHGDGSPVPGRAAQGDAIGWAAAAARAAGLIGSARHAARILSQSHPVPWRDRADYWEGAPGDYLGNAIASGDGTKWVIPSDHGPAGPTQGDKSSRRLVRELGDPGSGLDSAAAWAVRPFSEPSLYSAARGAMLRLVRAGGRFGITPGAGWSGGEDPWSAPTAWTAWSLAALANDEARPAQGRADRLGALRLLAALRRSATPAGALPERVDARTGVPVSTTPLAWSHAFAVLALRELWPSR